jgi:hypothetical protein
LKEINNNAKWLRGELRSAATSQNMMIAVLAAIKPL